MVRKYCNETVTNNELEVLGTTPPKMYLGTYLHSKSGYHPYIQRYNVGRTRSFADQNNTRAASGTCGSLPMPPGPAGQMETCTKDPGALWTVCNVGCVGAGDPLLWSTTRDNNKSYRSVYVPPKKHNSIINFVILKD